MYLFNKVDDQEAKTFQGNANKIKFAVFWFYKCTRHSKLEGIESAV